MKSHRVNAESCPACGSYLDGASCITDSDDAPAYGDVTVCFYCLTTLSFADDMSLRVVTPEAWLALDVDQRTALKAFVEIIRAAHKDAKR